MKVVGNGVHSRYYAAKFHAFGYENSDEFWDVLNEWSK